jgi:general secretion pathway protein G
MGRADLLVNPESTKRWKVRGPGKEDSGFTMLELLIVIVVLGVLAATVIFDLGSTVSNAAVSSCNSDAKTVQIAVQAFHSNSKNTADPDSYPNASTGSPSGNSQLTDPSSSAYGGPYLSAWPSSSHYTITLDASTPGQVDVNGVNFDSTPNPCTGVS